MKYYLVTTEHLEDKVWFRDSDDFVVAMNLVAVVAFTLKVSVLAFILMSNHVHFVLECEKWMAEMFINELKKQYSRYFRLKYGVKELLRGNKNDIQELSLEDESLERAIAYVQMNCVAANICAEPFSYPWGTGGAFFKAYPHEGKSLCCFSGRHQARLLHSKVKLPGNSQVGKDGYILPESYVKVKFVESVFRTPKRYNYFLRNSSKAKKRQNSVDSSIPSFKDQIIIASLPDLCSALFGVGSVSSLEHEQLTELFRQLRYRFSSNVEQMARVTGIPVSSVIQSLDRI